MKTSSSKSGVIVNCLWAPVREKPNNESEIICEISCLSEVRVFLEKDIDIFHFIQTSAGDEGYCLKEFIALKN